MELEKKIKIIREARKQVEGDITIFKYIKIKDKNNWPTVPKMTENHKWNELKNLAFEETYIVRKSWTIEEAIQNYKDAQVYYQKEKLLVREYEEYVAEYGGPSRGFISKRYKWSDFRKLVDGERVAKIDKDKNSFCDVCLEKENCEIELEECEYWREWNGNKQKSSVGI